MATIKKTKKVKPSKRSGYPVATVPNGRINREVMRSYDFTLSGHRIEFATFTPDVVDSALTINDAYLKGVEFYVPLKVDTIVNSTIVMAPRDKDGSYNDVEVEVEVVRSLGGVRRSDGYTFNGFLQKNGKVMILAGCQIHLSTADYRKHIELDYLPKKKKEKGAETLAILKFFDELAKGLPKLNLRATRPLA